MKKTWIILLIVSVFAAGLAIGRATSGERTPIERSSEVREPVAGETHVVHFGPVDFHPRPIKSAGFGISALAPVNAAVAETGRRVVRDVDVGSGECPNGVADVKVTIAILSVVRPLGRVAAVRLRAGIGNVP